MNAVGLSFRLSFRKQEKSFHSSHSAYFFLQLKTTEKDKELSILAEKRDLNY